MNGRRSILALAGLIIICTVNAAQSLAATKGFTRAESLEEFEKDENYAVIVGVNRYSSDDIGNLRYAVEDAKRLSEFFGAQGYEVRTLLDYEASPQDILKEVEKVATLATSGGAIDGGNVVFAFSGHGFRDKAGQNYLATGQTRLTALNDTALSLEDVKKTLRDGGVRQRVLFVDACRNIPGQKSIQGDRAGFSLDKEAQGEAVLYSTRAGELSWEDPQLGHGVFTHYLLEALSGAAQDSAGLITFNELQKHVARGVKRHVSRRFDDIQIPYQGGERSSLGEFVLARTGDALPAPVDPDRQYAQLEATMGLTRNDKQRVQQALNAAGYDVGLADGIWGKRTREGIENWQEAMGFTASGYLDETSYKELVAELVIDTPTVADVPTPTRRGYEPEMVRIEGGRFQMGSTEGDDDEKPVRSVNVKSFGLGRTEVTVSQWRAFVEDSDYITEAENDVGSKGCYSETSDKGNFDWVQGRSWRDPGFKQGEDHPVVCVSWNDVQQYIAWLNRTTAGGYRLPSEAEWEYAARAGSTGKYHFGENASELCRYGNVADESTKKIYPGWTAANCTDGYVYTSPVGAFAANANALNDMHGNVWEWQEDCWHESYEGAPTQGSAWIEDGDCGRRVLRGGSWGNNP
ncbi:MAG: SUMF1/EgtB/PvdO family nonheme iron enzyme, partial [Granulosicoccus sp.]